MASYNILVSGTIAFKKGTPEELRQEIVKEIEEELGVNFELNKVHDEYTVLKWSSKIVKEDGLRRIHQKWKPFFSFFDIMLYYLAEPDYMEFSEDEDHDATDVFTTAVNELCYDDEVTDTEDFNSRLSGLTAFLKFADLDKELVTRKIAELLKVMDEEDIKVNEKVLTDLISTLDEKNYLTPSLKKLLLLVV